jgi:hypothetical protein
VAVLQAAEDNLILSIISASSLLIFFFINFPARIAADLEELRRQADECIQRIHALLPRLTVADLHRLVRWVEWLAVQQLPVHYLHYDATHNHLHPRSDQNDENRPPPNR